MKVWSSLYSEYICIYRLTSVQLSFWTLNWNCAIWFRNSNFVFLIRRSSDEVLGHSNRVFSIRSHPSDNNCFLSGGWDNTVQVRFWEPSQFWVISFGIVEWDVRCLVSLDRICVAKPWMWMKLVNTFLPVLTPKRIHSKYVASSESFCSMNVTRCNNMWW
jgi:WD40 repeat protein